MKERNHRDEDIRQLRHHHHHNATAIVSSSSYANHDNDDRRRQRQRPSRQPGLSQVMSSSPRTVKRNNPRRPRGDGRRGRHHRSVSTDGIMRDLRMTPRGCGGAGVLNGGATTISTTPRGFPLPLTPKLPPSKSRLTRLSTNEMEEDYNLEVAWIDTEIHNAKARRMAEKGTRISSSGGGRRTPSRRTPTPTSSSSPSRQQTQRPRTPSYSRPSTPAGSMQQRQQQEQQHHQQQQHQQRTMEV